MENIICSGFIFLAVALLAPQIIQAQGTMAYFSNLGQTSTGSLAVGSDSWLAALFITGTNSGGYTLDSIQLGMADASGNPGNFTVMLYGNGNYPGALDIGSNLGTLDGSLNPVSRGIFTYTAASNLILTPITEYFIVLTAATVVAKGAYNWSYVSTNFYSPSGGWSSRGVFETVLTSSDGLSWSPNLGSGHYSQFAINATAIPEPGSFCLLGLGGLAFLWHRRKAKAD
jgi:hypothetical protein